MHPIHVFPDGDRWLVKRDRSPEPLSSHLTEAQAVLAGRVTAQANHVCFELYDQEGRLRVKHSYQRSDAEPEDN